MSVDKPIIGIVGGIGSGKSLVAAILARFGGWVIDADKFGHEALRLPAIRDALVQRWGKEILDENGEVDRQRVASIVFRDPEEKRALERLVFPYISRRIDEEVARGRAQAGVRFIVLDAAIMLETGWADRCDRLIFVDAPWPKRVERLAAARGWTEEEVRRRTAAQMPIEEKKARADVILDNSGTPEQTEEQLKNILEQWKLLE